MTLAVLAMVTSTGWVLRGGFYGVGLGRLWSLGIGLLFVQVCYSVTSGCSWLVPVRLR